MTGDTSLALEHLLTTTGRAMPASPEILSRVHAEIIKFTQTPDIRARFAAQGVELQASASPSEFTAFIKSEYVRWGKVMDDAGITPDQ